jgi:hypothetical protein
MGGNEGHHSAAGLPRGRLALEDFIEATFQFQRVMRIAFAAVRAGSDALRGEVGDDPVPGGFVSVGIKEKGFIQVGQEVVDFVRVHQDASLLPHECGLQVSDGCRAVQEGHDPVERQPHGLSLIHQSQRVPDQDKLLPLVLDREKLQISSYRGEGFHGKCLMRPNSRNQKILTPQ